MGSDLCNRTIFFLTIWSTVISLWPCRIGRGYQEEHFDVSYIHRVFGLSDATGHFLLKWFLGLDFPMSSFIEIVSHIKRFPMT